MVALRLYTRPASIGAGHPSSSVAVIGEFDGLHMGHQALVAEARRSAAPSARSVVAVVLDRGDGSPALTTLARRCELLLGAGADITVVVGAGRDERDGGDATDGGPGDLSAVARAVREVLGADVAFVACPPEPAGPLRWPALRPALAQAGIEVVELPRHRDRHGRAVTAALIAAELTAGRIESVTEVLGRPHRLSGVVELGDQRGRTIGFPTANIPLDHHQVWPGLGVYAARVRAGAKEYSAAVNIGVRPTIYGPDGAPVLEAHLLDFDADLYGEVLDIDLIERLRAERQFDSLDGLVTQLRSDVVRARSLLI